VIKLHTFGNLYRRFHSCKFPSTVPKHSISYSHRFSFDFKQYAVSIILNSLLNMIISCGGRQMWKIVRQKFSRNTRLFRLNIYTKACKLYFFTMNMYLWYLRRRIKFKKLFFKNRREKREIFLHVFTEGSFLHL